MAATKKLLRLYDLLLRIKHCINKMKLLGKFLINLGSLSSYLRTSNVGDKWIKTASASSFTLAQFINCATMCSRIASHLSKQSAAPPFGYKVWKSSSTCGMYKITCVNHRKAVRRNMIIKNYSKKLFLYPKLCFEDGERVLILMDCSSVL